MQRKNEEFVERLLGLHEPILVIEEEWPGWDCLEEALGAFESCLAAHTKPEPEYGFDLPPRVVIRGPRTRVELANVVMPDAWKGQTVFRWSIDHLAVGETDVPWAELDTSGLWPGDHTISVVADLRSREDEEEEERERALVHRLDELRGRDVGAFTLEEAPGDVVIEVGWPIGQPMADPDAVLDFIALADADGYRPQEVAESAAPASGNLPAAPAAAPEAPKIATTVTIQDAAQIAVPNAVSAPAHDASTLESSPLVDIEGIDKVYGKALAQQGLLTTADFLKVAARPSGRASLAAATSIPEQTVMRLVHHADLFRIKGVAGQYADLLHAAGVRSVPELARRNPENLAAKLATLKGGRVRRVPSPDDVKAWVEQAGQLPQAVFHEEEQP